MFVIATSLLYGGRGLAFDVTTDGRGLSLKSPQRLSGCHTAQLSTTRPLLILYKGLNLPDSTRFPELSQLARSARHPLL